MLQLTDALSPWHEFYALLGSASATMIGLLFVAATVGAGVFTEDRRAPMRVFLSASVVNFGIVLAICLIVLAPVQSWTAFSLMIIASAAFGLAHSALACRDTVRDGLFRRMDREDRTWYIALPPIGYLFVVAAGVTLALELAMGCAALAISIAWLLVVGLHNAWDITVWSMARRRQ